MRPSQVVMLVLFTFVACSFKIGNATDDKQITYPAINSNNELVHEAHRYLKGNKKPTKTIDAVNEERATPSFKQLFGLLRFPKNLARLPGLQQLAQLRNKFGNNAGNVLNAYNSYVKKFSRNAQM
ncbi:Avirulence protein (Avh) [Phytophthora palmivora]|uniref:Avirulence protein (Avh) n=1 Tax=Phytophthora palmivora TaxID=4796 RepID=A0A2P4WZN8_9STRA|nr:Avirulence protein (Avh) [Phytophthora palmivora]